MSLEIVFSPLALDTLVSIAESINAKWGKKTSDSFKALVAKTLRTLSSQPYLFKASGLAPEKRKGTLSKQTSFFYQIHQNHIEILFLLIIDKILLLNNSYRTSTK
jgi:plasmid stabilization system protein ParE